MVVDTNIVLLMLQPNHPMTDIVRKAMRLLHDRGYRLSITAQNLVELWAVATRQFNKNGLGLSPSEVSAAIEEIQGLFKFLPDTADIFPAWRQIVAAYKVTGRSTHDARLVAAMRVHGETSILTFDKGFNRYSAEIDVINPSTVIAQ